MKEIRRHLHRHPEVSYKEFETTDFIISRLEELGIPVGRPLETECVGIIERKNPWTRSKGQSISFTGYLKRGHSRH